MTVVLLKQAKKNYIKTSKKKKRKIQMPNKKNVIKICIKSV